MPKFVWLRNALLGPMPSILHDTAVFGVKGDKDLGILQGHEITIEEACQPLSVLSLRYRYAGDDNASDD